MLIAEHPLHRSGRAALPHPAPTLGNNAKAHERIGMADVSGRQLGGDQGLHSTPRQVIALTATAQHLPPQPAELATEGTNSGAVHGHAVVAHMPGNDRAQIRTDYRDGVVHTMLPFGFHRPQLRLPPFSHRLAQHRKATLARLPATVREAKKVEAPRRSPITAFLSIRPLIAAELDESRFPGMQLQTKVRKPFAQLGQEPLGLDSMLENPATKSSAKRTTMTSPRACLCLHRWTRRSNT